VTGSFDFSGWFFETMFKIRKNLNVLLFNNIVHLLCFIKGVKVGKKVDFNGFPLIRRCQDSRITIGDSCTLYSARNSVHIGLDKPCTFVTREKNAEIIFGNNCGASALTVVACSSVRIGNNVLIGAHSSIFDTDFHHAEPGKRLDKIDIPTRPVIIEDNVFLGSNCFVLKGVTIGENSVIGANSVVISNIPRNSIAMGNPCKVIIIKNWETAQK
jgi:acetyltransferase-like isoleucine patch superfamily enzyme